MTRTHPREHSPVRSKDFFHGSNPRRKKRAGVDHVCALSLVCVFLKSSSFPQIPKLWTSTADSGGAARHAGDVRARVVVFFLFLFVDVVVR